MPFTRLQSGRFVQPLDPGLSPAQTRWKRLVYADRDSDNDPNTLLSSCADSADGYIEFRNSASGAPGTQPDDGYQVFWELIDPDTEQVFVWDESEYVEVQFWTVYKTGFGPPDWPTSSFAFFGVKDSTSITDGIVGGIMRSAPGSYRVLAGNWNAAPSANTTVAADQAYLVQCAVWNYAATTNVWLDNAACYQLDDSVTPALVADFVRGFNYQVLTGDLLIAASFAEDSDTKTYYRLIRSPSPPPGSV